ncbi:MAG: signal peptide prediction [Halobacteriovoraceae bacterium]|nr:signal peptide prediction [Halobacteriovoraceae bacterium]|tara:strand:+ start:9756 stop:11012 length:1257 start_codon:yes stop_codon:yes gene_type:complete
MKRREFIEGSLKGMSGILAYSKAPYIFSKTQTKLRVLGTHVTLQEELKKRAMKDLGIDLIFEAKGSAAVLQKAAASPESFDLYEQWSGSINILWHAKAIQAIDTERLKYWKEVNPLSKTGKITPEAKMGLGDSPNKIIYVQKDGSIGAQASDKISFLPYVHNVDSFGYNTDLIPKGKEYDSESWSWLLDEKYKGKVALVNAPTIGIFDAALAVQAKGLMNFKDMGNMSVKEIDQLFSILMEYKRKGHFAGFWTSVPQSAEFMVQKRVWIQSMFSPGVSMSRGQGIPVTYASPKEGYRAWHGVMCMSSQIKDKAKDAAYEYMNWWLSGYPGAFIARQGYYISNPERSRSLMTKEEWDYWYEGKPARNDLKGTDGKVSVKAGEIRDGGSYVKRFSNIAVWNTVMDNYDYSLDKWYEFLNS